MRIDVLGPLEVTCNGNALAIGTRKRQSVLALLAVNAGRVVGMDDLVDELWPERPPASAVANLQGYASGLRRLFEAAEPGRDRLIRQGSGYVFLADPAELDLARFGAHVAEGHDALRGGNAKAAAARLADGLDLWRGAMLAGLARGPILAIRCTAVEEERLAVAEDLAEALLAINQPGEAVALIRQQVRDHPLRERGHVLLIRGLDRTGDIAGALAGYADARAALADQLGIEPGPDLQELHRAILNREQTQETLRATATAPAAARRAEPAPAQLPPDVYGFTGRRPELDRLDALLSAATDSPTAVVISAIAGTAGVGKTAVAVHWAHRVSDRFPDGQLYVNLRGFDPAGPPASPAEAVRGFLDGLHVPPQRIPADLPAQVGLYRSLLAGRRMVIVLDNARDAEQVRPLLPGVPGCLALVTSRNQLASLVAIEGAHPLALDLLTPAEARDLLVRRLGPGRIAEAADAVDEIINRCARLPLALAIVAARAATNPHLPLASLAAELRDARTKLDALTTGDAATDVRAVFSSSYRQLSPGAARLFRLLGLHPGPDISVSATASLAGLLTSEVRHPLTELVRANLITEHTPGRYTLHDLLRAYARQLAQTSDAADQRRAANLRILDHYLHTADTCALLMYPTREAIPYAPPQPGFTSEDIADDRHALAWLTAERPVLLAAVHHAASAGLDGHTWQLAWALAPFLDRRGHWHDWATIQRVALAAAERLADLPAQALAHRMLGIVHTRLDCLDDAHTELRLALDQYRQCGDRPGEAYTRVSFAQLCERQRRYRPAFDHTQQALDLFRAADHRRGQAYALNNLGWYHAHLGELQQALASCEEALALQKQLGNHLGQADACDSLGYTHHHLGNHAEAITCYRQALRLFREIGYRYNEADTFTNLGDTYHAVGNVGAARLAWQQALAILDDLDHPNAEQVRTRLQHHNYPGPEGT